MFLLIAIASVAFLPPVIKSSNLALTFNAANNTCTAACSSCNSLNNINTKPVEGNEAILQLLRGNAKLMKETQQKIESIVNSLSYIKNTTTSNAGAINDILLLMEDMQIRNDSSSLMSPLIPMSCKEIKRRQPSSPSGVYLLAIDDSSTKYVYCNMGELCGSGGGWTRLAYLDMSDSTESCPSGFKLYQSGGIRACGRTKDGCVSVTFPSNGISYSQVCGRVVGYQYGHPDAVSIRTNLNNINSNYVDGVSITRGSPRKHVWTLMAGLHEASYYNHVNDGRYNCPCSKGSTQNVPSFIGNDYFCESGNPVTDGTLQATLYVSDPLWDGKGCGSFEGNCCTAPGLPWFNKVLHAATTDYLELRVCADESISGEDSPVSFYEIYVK